MTRTLQVLHLEDRPTDAAVIRDRLEFEGVLCQIRVTDCQSGFESALAEADFDLIIADYHLPGYGGIAALTHVLATRPDVPVILVSGTVSEEEAVKCLQFGATDYLLKGRLDRLAPAVLRAIDEAQSRRTRKRTEQALVQSERRKAAILDSVLDCIITMDAAGVVIEFNTAAERTFGYTKAEAIGRSLVELIVPVGSRHAPGDPLAGLLATGGGPIVSEVVEGTARRADGSELQVELSITAVDEEQARIFTGVLRDITSRKGAEAALRAERDRAQRFLDTADVTLLALNVDGLITLINRRGCDLLGWTEAELLGQDFIAKCIPVRSRISVGKKFAAVLAGDLSMAEVAVVTKSAEERVVEWRSTLLTDDAGRITGALSSGTDITERSHAIAALQTAEERMRFALQSANVGIWDMDYATGMLRWSEILEAHYGVAAGTFAGTFEAFIDRVHPDDRQSFLEAVGKAKSAGCDFSLLNRPLAADGAVRWLSGAGRVVLGEDGLPARAIGISQDVTTRHRLEQQSQQTQKMEAIGQLAGGVAHDFNNLLTIILGYCEMMLEDLGPTDPCHGGLVEIQKAGDSAAGLTRQLLAFSRKEIISPTLLDVNVVLTNMRVMLRRLIREDVKIELTMHPEVAPVMADQGQLEQVVLNLAVNARDAMPKGGNLKIQVATVALDERYAMTHPGVQPGPYVALTVTDTGDGIPLEVQEHIFEPFFTTKASGRGTGLGLATVHGIVTQNGGNIEVSSVVGTGTTFRLYFPRALSEAADPAVVAPAVRARGGGETVLVVEDAEGLRHLIRSLLTRLGYTVLVAANATDARALFVEHQSVDLLLTDVVMPGGSGPDLSRWLVEGHPELKVLYMSGYADEAIVTHGVLDPAIAFVHKPFTAQALGLKVREVLDH